MAGYARIVSEKKQLELPHTMGEKNKLKLQMASSIMAGLLSNPFLLGVGLTVSLRLVSKLPSAKG